MKFPGLDPRRSRALFLMLGQLVLVAYLFQVAAFDHWRVDPGRDIAGVTGSDSHVSHCHGDAASCADAAGTIVSLAQEAVARLPVDLASLALESPASEPAPQSTILQPQSKPPRAA
jgi:hypothetical protein